jgi:phage terminase large subunit GpA-like protein
MSRNSKQVARGRIRQFESDMPRQLVSNSPSQGSFDLVKVVMTRGDPLIERVTVIKSARIGYTTLLVGALANYVQNDPSSLVCLLPVKEDARNFVVSQVEPVFAESPVVRAKLDAPKSHAHDRDTMLFRRFTGGSIRVVSAEA